VVGVEEPNNAPHGQAALQPFAEINYETGYRGLIAAFRQRVAQRRISVTSQDIAQISGLPSHYFCKILSPSKNPAKRFGAASLGPILACLGLKIVLCEDVEALEKYAKRLPARNESFVHTGTVNFVLTRRHLRAIQRKGGKNSRLYMTKRQASVLARKAVKARWAKRKQNSHGAASSAGEIAS
jgi:hypothetical protein